MSLHRIIRPESVLCDIDARSKKYCLEVLGELLAGADPAVGKDEIFANLVERERLGCTALADGVAFPHCRVSGAESSSGALVRLAEPVEFESPDGVPVDLVFGLMVPAELNEGHREDIAAIRDLLSDERLHARLRAARDRDELYDALVSWPGGVALRSGRAQG